MSYGINETIFNEPWTEENAYALGYLMADGSVYRGETRERYDLTISGNKLDTLQTIKEILGAEHSINRVGSNSWQMRISNRYIVERLEDLGLSDNKVTTLTYPNLPAEVQRHFIRGYFDGKGSFMAEQGRRIVSNISGANLEFMEDLRDRLVTLGLTRATIHQYGDRESSNQIRYYVRDTRRLYSLLYDGARVYSRDHIAKYQRGYSIQGEA